LHLRRRLLQLLLLLPLLALLLALLLLGASCRSRAVQQHGPKHVSSH
jgi:hypothetical protein